MAKRDKTTSLSVDYNVGNEVPRDDENTDAVKLNKIEKIVREMAVAPHIACNRFAVRLLAILKRP